MEGPWTRPSASAHASLKSTRSSKTLLAYADDEIAVVLLDKRLVTCWDTATGRLLWVSYSRVGSSYSDDSWRIDQSCGCISHVASRLGLEEIFQIGDGSCDGPMGIASMSPTGARRILVEAFDITPNRVAIGTIQSYQIQTGSLASCTRYFVHGGRASTACFDPEGRLVDYDEEAANTWLRYLGNGYPQPVEAAWLELDEMGRSLGPKKPRD